MDDRILLNLPADFCGEVRLFPLPDLVFFPNSIQPLHIFESRYREMFEDAIGDDQLLAMATLLPGYEIDYYSRPPVAPEICIGSIVRHDQNEDGTYDFLLLGLKRARIEHEIEPVRSYRRAAVQLPDEQPLGDRAEADQLAAQLAARLVVRAPKLRKLLDAAIGRISLGTFTDIVAQNLNFDRSFKLELLGESDSFVRARWLLDKLSRPAEG